MADVNAVVDYEYKVSGTEQAASGMQGLISKAVLLAAAYQAVRAASDFMSSSISSAIDANEQANKFMVVMGESAESVTAQLQAFAEVTNRNFYELRQLAAGVQDMLVPMGVARDEAAQMSTEFVKLATDMASFNNVPVADTLAAIQSGLAGQSRPLRQFGVDTRVAALEAQALAMGIDQEWAAMDQATQANVLYAKIVRDTADAQGDAARTSDQAANVMVGFTSAIEEAKVQVGNQFLPVIETLVPMLEDLGAQVLPQVIDAASEMADALLDYGPDLIELISKIIDAMNWLAQASKDADTASRWIAGYATLGVTEAIRGYGELAEAQRITRENSEFLASLPALTLPGQDSGPSLMDSLSGIAAGATGAGQSFLTMANDYAAANSVMAASGPIGGGSLGDDPTGIGKSDMASRAQAQAEVIMMTLEATDAKRAEIDARAMSREQAIYEQRLNAIQGVADRSIDIIMGGFEGGFDRVIDGFKGMLTDMASEYLKSQIFKIIFGAAGKAATGGAGFFL